MLIIKKIFFFRIIIMEKNPKLKKTTEVHSGKWVRFLLADYENRGKLIQNYEYCERVTRVGEVDGVIIVGIVSYPESKANNQIVLIANYRVTANSYVLEFPAGLVDESGKEISEATRELEEETGYIPEKIISIVELQAIPQISNMTYAEPSITNENEKFVLLEINGDKEANKQRQQKLEEAEDIIVHLLEFNENFLSNLIELAKKHGYQIESKLYTFALGYTLGKSKL